MDYQDTDTRVEQVGDGSPASLRRAICEAAERIGELEAERCALAEVRDNVEMQRRDAEGRLAEAQRSLARMRAAVEASSWRAAELEAEADAAATEIAALEHREQATARRLEALVGEADALAREQRVRREAAAAIGLALEGVCDTIQRIDQKIKFADRKFGTVRPSSVGGTKG